MHKKFAITAGFTLIETLIAILILTVAIVGPLSIASRGLGTALISKDQTIAFYLAQDAVEYVRYRRDSNRLAGNADMLAGLDGTGGCTSSAGCTVDSIADTVSACSGVCAPLKYDSTDNYYTYSSSYPNSIFTRTVLIKTPVCSTSGVCNAEEAAITVNVTWNDVSGTTHTVSLRENLLNWQ